LISRTFERGNVWTEFHIPAASNFSSCVVWALFVVQVGNS